MSTESGDLFGWGGGKAERDKGFEKTIRGAGDWWPLALSIVRELPAGWEGAGEELTRLVIRTIGPPPRSMNIFGTLVSQAQRRKWLIKTGKRRHMRKTTSHSRMTDVLRRTFLR